MARSGSMRSFNESEEEDETTKLSRLVECLNCFGKSKLQRSACGRCKGTTKTTLEKRILSATSKLYMNDLHLSAIPPKVMSRNTVSTILLDGNMLASLPLKFGHSFPHLRILRLFGNHLEDLPESFFLLPEVKMLYLHDNRLLRISPKFGNLKHLETLTLEGNRFSDFPREFGKLSTLTKLSFDVNNILYPPEYVLQQCHADPLQVVRYLNALLDADGSGSLRLDSWQLPEFPLDAIRMTHLSELSLSQNSISQIPEWVYWQLTNLTRLDLRGNPIDIISTHIANLSLLQELSLDIAGVVKPPGEVISGGVRHVVGFAQTMKDSEISHVLDLGGANFAHIPMEVTELTNLVSLSMDANVLETLPDRLSVLDKLQLLELSGNRLPGLCQSLKALSRLETLRCKANRLAQLDADVVSTLTMLKTADFSKNKISAIEENSMGCWKQVTHLNLSTNCITQLPDDIWEMAALKVLHLQHNDLAKLPKSFGDLPNLIQLDLRDNVFAKFPVCLESIRSLQRVNLAENMVTALPSSSCYELTALGQLDLSDNRIKELPLDLVVLVANPNMKCILKENPFSFPPPEIWEQGWDSVLKYLDKLKSARESLCVDLSHLKFSDIHRAAFATLPTLTALNLSQCQIKSVPLEVFELTDLEELNLDGNVLESLPLTQSLCKLRRLSIQGNLVKDIGPSFLLLTSLTELIALNNPSEAPTVEVIQQKTRIEDLREYVQKVNVRGESFELDGLQLKHLPPELTTRLDATGLTCITRLSLVGNALQSLPHSFSRLQMLRELNLDENLFQTLPPIVCTVQQICKLSIRGNPMTRIPHHVITLVRLDHVECDWDLLEHPSRDVYSQSIPFMLEYLEHLTESRATLTVCLHQKGLKSINKDITELLHLTALDLSHNSLMSIPDEIENLPNLTILSLLNCNIEVIPDKLSRLQRAKTIELDGNHIKKIPDTLLSITTLTHLSLSKNELSELPIYMSMLPALKYLNVADNGLENLPKQFIDCPALEYFFVSRNQLQCIPSRLQKVTTLKTLDLSNNNLSRFPKRIRNWKQIETIDISGNNIQELSVQFGELFTLTSLDFSNNPISSPPQVITKQGNWSSFLYLRQLATANIITRNLHLDDIGFGFWPKQVLAMTNLTELSFCGNGIDIVDPAFEKFAVLLHLHLDRNEIVWFPQPALKLTNLTSLTLSRNKLNAVPETILNFPNLTNFNVQENPLESPPRFVLEQGDAQDLTRMTLWYLAEIRRAREQRKLDISGKDIREHIPELTYMIDSSKLLTLQHMDLSNNQFDHLPDTFLKLSELISLDVSHNCLVSVHPTILMLPKLRHCILAHNKITHFPKSIGRLLRTLDMTGNMLQSLPPYIAQWSQLEHLGFEENPIVAPPADVVARGNAEILEYLGRVERANDTGVFFK